VQSAIRPVQVAFPMHCANSLKTSSEKKLLKETGKHVQ